MPDANRLVLDATLAELEHAFKFNDAVLRHLIVAMREAVIAPSPMMREEKPRSSDRDGERGERGDRPDRGERSERGERPERVSRASVDVPPDAAAESAASA